MSDQHKLEKPRTPKRFYFLTILIYFPILYSLAIIHAHWYGFVLAGASFAGLMWLRHSPIWHGFRVPLCFMAAFVLAFTGLVLSRPQKDVSLMGQIGRESLRLVLRLPVDDSVRSGDFLNDVSTWSVPDGYELLTVELPHCQMEILRPLEGAPRRAVLQLHGGAFVSGMNDLYRTFAVRYSEYTMGGVVATVDYRLWPDSSYPAQQQDVMDAWRYLVEDMKFAPEDVLVVGDSAGGNLTLSLALSLRDAGQPMPRALVCMSPWADLSNSGPSHIANATIDPTFGVPPDEYDGLPIGVPTTYADHLDATDSSISPSFGDYTGFPPMLLQAGGDEVLLSDSEMVYTNAQLHGADCTLTVYPGMFHVFQGSLNLLPESRQAWEEIAAFIARVYGVEG